MQGGIGEVRVGVHGGIRGLEGSQVLTLVTGYLDFFSGEVNFQHPHFTRCNVVWKGGGGGGGGG